MHLPALISSRLDFCHSAVTAFQYITEPSSSAFFLVSYPPYFFYKLFSFSFSVFPTSTLIVSFPATSSVVLTSRLRLAVTFSTCFSNYSFGKLHFYLCICRGQSNILLYRRRMCSVELHRTEKFLITRCFSTEFLKLTVHLIKLLSEFISPHKQAIGHRRKYRLKGVTL